MNHKNTTYETIESSSQRVQLCKRLIQEFGVILIFIKGVDNVVADDYSWLPMVHQAHKLANTTLEEDTCKLLCLDELLILDNTDCFSLDIEKILFPLAPKILKA